ncbi:GntR family transcriptional regulator [Pseudemcibacter sp.]|jgi:DNA-binding GntR family transcriptional regulator|uniref:GntR family transcriptional regulator n=1 Tax=Pseudemcibacter sp. TaxID=2943293 RepID=UPI003F698BF3
MLTPSGTTTSKELPEIGRNFDDMGEEKSLGERTYLLISDMILKGELAYGDPVQERRLAEHMNVSRTPVREAISRLEAEGFLERSGGRVVVREVRLKEFVEILHVRKLLECDAVREAAKNADAKELQKIRGTIEKLMEKRSVTALELREVDDMFHNFIARSSNNSLVNELINDLRRRTAMFDHERLPDRKQPGSKEHLNIIDALEKRDGALASTRMARHINNVHSSIFEHWGFNK